MATRCTRRTALVGLMAAGGSMALPLSMGQAARPGLGWRAAWGAALQPAPSPEVLPAGAALRRTVISSIAGEAFRLEVSNRYGTGPLELTAHVATPAGAADVTFGSGLARFVVPTGAVALSDRIALPLSAGTEIEVTVALPAGGTVADVERTSGGDGATLTRPDGSSAAALAGILATVDVFAPSGRTITVLSDTKSARPGSWVDRVAELAAGQVAMVNRSVYGGRLALGEDPSNALARFDHDVLATSGATAMVVFCGNNDLIQPGMMSSRGTPMLDPALMQSEAQLQALLAQTATRAHAAGQLAIAATWTPYEGVTIAEGYSTPEKMERRAAINDWMRSSGTFDHVIDFDAALRDPARLSRLDPRYDAGNHFTPNAAGVEKMAQTAFEVLSTIPSGGSRID